MGGVRSIDILTSVAKLIKVNKIDEETLKSKLMPH
jgi:hypothetical protein